MGLRSLEIRQVRIASRVPLFRKGDAMDKSSVLTKTLAVIGVLFAWTPLLAPLSFGMIRLAQTGRLRVDYLMPAEIAPVAFVGGGLLLWAAFRAGAYRRAVGWSVAVMAAMLAGMATAATATGLASGASPAEGWRLWLVDGLLAGYAVALGVLAVTGTMLLMHLMGAHKLAGTA